MANEPVEKWLDKSEEYVNNPTDTNSDKVKEIQNIACEHQVDDYLASLLYVSKI
mgnify:CR=1 FL=1